MMIERGIVKCRYGFCDLRLSQLGYGLLASMGWITRDSHTADLYMRQRRRQTGPVNPLRSDGPWLFAKSVKVHGERL